MSTTSGTWILTERLGLSRGPELIRDALLLHRREFSALLGRLDPSAWSTPAHRSLWSVHEVARHLADVAEFHTARLTDSPERERFERFGPFNPATTPAKWLEASSGESPQETMRRLARVTDEEFRAFGVRVEEGADTLEPSAARRQVLWSVRSLHVLWDAWLHERDVTVALGIDAPSDASVLRLVTMYGLLIAAGASALRGSDLQTSIALDGGPDLLYEIASHEDDVRVTVVSEGVPALSGRIEAVLESLAGRGPHLHEVVGVSNHVTDGLSRLRTRMT